MDKSTSKKIVLLNETTLDSMVEKDSISIIKNFTEVGIKILEADFGFAWWKFHDEEEYKLAYKSLTTPYEPTLPRESAGNYVARKTKKPFFDSQVKKENYKYDISKYLKSYIIIPIYYNELIYGSLVLCYKKEHLFTDDEVDLAKVLGTTTAQAITIHNLLEREQEARVWAEKQEAYFRALIENSHEDILLIDHKGKVLYISSSISKIFDKNAEDILGKNIREFISSSYAKVTEEYIERILKKPNENHLLEFDFIKKDGNTRSIESTAVNMLKNENVKGIVLNIRDQTFRKESEMLKETEILLNEEKLKSEFIANATHEFRTPLAVIRGTADLALIEDSKASFKKAFNSINSEVEHLSHMISDLTLLTGKRASVKSKIIPKRINLTESIREIAKRLGAIARKRNIKIRLQNMPEVFVEGDEVYLSRLFINLITNAVTYGKVGGWISINIQKKEKTVEIKVKDNGVGIAKEDIPHIFDRFYRVDKSHSSDSKNTGLGLAIVRWVALVHNGGVEVASKVGKGTTFTVWFPISK